MGASQWLGAALTVEVSLREQRCSCCLSVALDRKAAHCRRGKAKYTNGGRYEGDFKKEHRWGWGLHIFPDGDRYEGQWVDDKIQGGRADLIVISAVCVAACSIAAWPPRSNMSMLCPGC